VCVCGESRRQSPSQSIRGQDDERIGGLEVNARQLRLCREEGGHGHQPAMEECIRGIRTGHCAQKGQGSAHQMLRIQ
jgi:hypothetical protein